MVSVKLIRAMPKAAGQSTSVNEKLGGVREGCPAVYDLRSRPHVTASRRSVSPLFPRLQRREKLGPVAEIAQARTASAIRDARVTLVVLPLPSATHPKTKANQNQHWRGDQEGNREHR